MKGKGRDIYNRVTTSSETGEVVETVRVARVSAEPEYYKVYTNMVLTFKGLPKSLDRILWLFLNNIRYCGDKGKDQYIFINKRLKEQVADQAGVSMSRVNHAVSDFCKVGIFHKVANCEYTVNPNIWGKGEWKEIEKMRGKDEWKDFKATFDFLNGDIELTAEAKYDEKGD